MQVFDFDNNLWISGFLIQGTSGFGFFEKNNQNQTTSGLGYFQYWKEPLLLTKELANQIKELSISELVLFFYNS